LESTAISIPLTDLSVLDSLSQTARLAEGVELPRKHDPFISIAAAQGATLVLSQTGTIVSAAAVVHSPANAQSTSQCFIGWYSSTADAQGAQTLFTTIEKLSIQNNCTELLGPIHTSTWSAYRLCTQRNTPPFALDVTNPSFFIEQWKTAGFTPFENYLSTQISREGFSFGRLKRAERLLGRRNIEVQGITTDSFEQDLQKIYSISTAAFTDNPFYAPVSFKLFCALYQSVQPLLHPRLCLVARAPDGSGAGFIFSYLDPVEPQLKRIIIKTLAVHPRHRSTGLGSYLVERVHYAARQLGAHSVIHALMHRNNISTNICSAHARTISTYSLFRKKVVS